MVNDNQSTLFSQMNNVLEKQKQAFLKEGKVSLETRIDRIARAIDLLERHGEKLCFAMATDFGHRSAHQSQMTDIYGSISSLNDAKERLEHWMKPEERNTMFPADFGATARIEYQPLGVIGCISPWNFPVQLAFGPLAGILAAGNRAMIKPSEHTPATSQLIKEIIEESFDIEEVAVFTGGVETGTSFSKLSFDHLLFTGASSVAKHIMRAAAENLVPVTLELGGKSPVIIGDSANIKDAASKIMAGKTINSGQICLAPDYVFIPSNKADEFIQEAQVSVEKMYPNIKDNQDYTSIINQQHFDRLTNYVKDAQQKGAQVVQINPAQEDFSQQHNYRIPPILVVEPNDQMLVMKEEIFGPILSVIKYTDINQAIDYINANPRPLGLYYFGDDAKEQETVLNHTLSGGVTINDVMMHAGQEDLPFGGVGASGMGSYHGYDGFKTFSHARAIYNHSDQASQITATMQPPYQQ